MVLEENLDILTPTCLLDRDGLMVSGNLRKALGKALTPNLSPLSIVIPTSNLH